jgi:hypothetical protein
MSIFSLLSSGILGQVGDIFKVFFGSKEERDAAIAEEMKAVQDAYKAELLAPQKIGFWGQFVDGINRLVRPLFTYGIVALFMWAAIDPITFQVTMVALGVVPDMLWYIMLTIIGFWFGGRLLEKMPTRISPISPKALTDILLAQKKIAATDVTDPVPDTTPVPEPVVEVKSSPSVTSKKKVWEGRRER